MPTIRPFRGLRYADRLGPDLTPLVAPPYDVISEERRATLAARHPDNIVHLDLPQPEGGLAAYEVAREHLAAWRLDGVLELDPRPALYACEQAFQAPGGGERVRRGLYARLRLEPFAAGVIIPHERTLDAPRDDRRRLLAATRTHLSAVFLLHPDPEGMIARRLAEVCSGAASAHAVDDDGNRSRVVRLEEGPLTAELVRRFEGQWALIADGHHRYESALAYREERRAAGTRDAEHVLAFLCSLQDPGLSLFPIHRLVRGLDRFSAATFRDRLSGFFSLSRIAAQGELRSALDGCRGRPGAFGLVFRGEEGAWLAEWKEGAGLDRAEMEPIPQPLRRLDVILLHRLVLEGMLGITPEAQARQSHLEYVKNDGDLIAAVRAGAADLGVLLNPTRIEQVVEVTRRGLRLPQKSTYFHPKVPTGFVLDPLDD
jgi:uncharacterized protein (DUF1015 family)